MNPDIGQTIGAKNDKIVVNLYCNIQNCRKSPFLRFYLEIIENICYYTYKTVSKTRQICRK